MTAHPLLAGWKSQLAELRVLIKQDHSDRAWLHCVRARVLEYLISRYGHGPSAQSDESTGETIPELRSPVKIAKESSGRPVKSPDVIRRLLADIHANAKWIDPDEDPRVN